MSAEAIKLDSVADPHGYMTDLANAVSDAIIAATKKGVEYDEACSVAVTVAADYARKVYGAELLSGLCHVILLRAAAPLPRDISEEADA